MSQRRRIKRTITVTANVASNAPASVTNTATVSGGGETNTANDTANDVTTINTPPDVTIAKTHSGNFFKGQTGATYRITVTNRTKTCHNGIEKCILRASRTAWAVHLFALRTVTFLQSS